MGKFKHNLRRIIKERQRQRARKRPLLIPCHKSEDKTRLENILRSKLVICDTRPESGQQSRNVPSFLSHSDKKQRKSCGYGADAENPAKRGKGSHRLIEKSSRRFKAVLRRQRDRSPIIDVVGDSDDTLYVDFQDLESVADNRLQSTLAKQMGRLEIRSEENPEHVNRQGSGPSTSFGGGAGNKALQRMRVAQFRMINEMLYTSKSETAEKLFKEDPGNFSVYHEGYRLQVGKWLLNPVDKVIAGIKEGFPRGTKIADLGCGEAKLAVCLKPLGYTVYSYDLVAANEHVHACNIRNVPMAAEYVDLAVMCLSLMGTDMGQFVLEANRILNMGGRLIVAEVESRIPSVEDFVRLMKRYGFNLESQETARSMFYFFTFRKVKAMPKGAEKNMDHVLRLNPCLYKKR